MIPQRSLSLLSNRLAQKGGRRIPEAILERDYCLSWFLVELSHNPLKDVLLFKGGTAIKKCYFPKYRFSKDLDFTLGEELPFEDIRKNLDITFERTQQASGVKLYFSHPDRHNHENSYTFYLGYEGPLPGTSGKEVKVDITIREKIAFSIKNRPILKGYTEYEDLPDDAVICVYSLNEIAAEKVVAIIDPARNEPRDLYDIWFLTSNRHVMLAEVVPAIEQKLEFRGKKFTNIKEDFLQKESRLEILWEKRLSDQMVTLPEFSQVYREVKREFRQTGLLTI